MSHPAFSLFEQDKHPAFSLFGDEGEPSLAVAQSNEAAMAAERKKKLQELLARPDISSEQRARIESMLAKENPQWRFGDPTDLARGAAAGVVQAGAGLVDFATNLADFVLPGKPLLQGVRDYVGESAAVAGEVAPDKTVLGAAGQVVGTIAASAAPYGAAARGTAGVLAKASPALGKVLMSGGKGLAGRAMSAGGNVLAGLPINALQAIVTQGGTPSERWKNFATQVGADALFGAIVPGAQLPKAALDAPRTPETRQSHLLPSGNPTDIQGPAIPTLEAFIPRDVAEARPEYQIPSTTRPPTIESSAGAPGPAIPTSPLSRIAEIEAERAKLFASESDIEDYKLNRTRNEAVRRQMVLDEEQRQLERTVAIQRWKTENPSKEWDALSAKSKKAWFKKAASDMEAAKAAATPPKTEAVPKLSTEVASERVMQNEANGVYDNLVAKWWPRIQAGDVAIGQPDADLPVWVALFKHSDGSLKDPSELKELLKSYDHVQFTGGDTKAWADGIVAKDAPTPAPAKTQLPQISPAALSAAPSSLKTEAIPRVIEVLESQAAVSPDPQVKVETQNRVVQLQEELARRKFKPKTFDANIPPELGSGILAGVIGYQGEGTEEEKMARAVKYAMYGVGGAAGAKWMLKRTNAIMAKKAEPRKIYMNGKEYDAPSLTRKELGRGYSSVQEWLRSYWIRATSTTARASVVPELMAQTVGLNRQSDATNFASSFRDFGKYQSQAETALKDRVVGMDASGNEVVYYNRGLGQILSDHFGGNIIRLSDLAQAHAEDELIDIARQQGKAQAVNMPQDLRTALKSSTTDTERAGLQALREWNSAMVEASLLGTKVSPEGLSEMKKQLWYTPLNKIVNDLHKAEFLEDDMMMTPLGVKPRKSGSADPVQNVYEAMVENTARMFRAGEEHRARAGFIDFAEALPPELRELVARRTDKPLPLDWQMSAASRRIREKMNLTEQTSKELADLLLGSAKRGQKEITVFRGGEKQKFLVNTDMYEAMRALNPYELNAAVRLFGLPARGLAKGVALHPWFAFYQSVIDGMAIAAQERYGLSLPDKVTGGYASVLKGWWHAAKETKVYKDFKAGGGPNTFQALEWTNPKTAVEATKRANLSRWDTAVAQAREFSPLQAARTLMEPLIEAPRIGAYLRALDHGETVLDAVNHAWNVSGNPRMQGAAASMRAINHMAPFLRPSIAALDKFAQNVGLHPLEPEPFKSGLGKKLQDRGFSPRTASQVSLVAKGFTAITVPTVLLWAVEHAADDQEIKEMRQTTNGQKYWFWRNPVSGEVMRIRKPHVLGQIFGTAAEAALDKMAGDDPVGTKQVAQGIVTDAWLNLMPTAGVIPVTLITGTDPNTGYGLIPRADERVDPALQGEAKSSAPARFVAGKVGDMTRQLNDDVWYERALKTGLTPAGLDYVVRSVSGMLGEDALRVVTNAVEWAQEGSPPPAEEWAVLRRMLVKTPTTNIKPVEDFYRRDQRIRTVAATIADLALSDPTRLQLYVAKHQNDIALIQPHREVKAELAELRRAINDIRSAPRSVMSMEQKRRVEESLTMAMVKIARAVQGPLDSLDKRTPIRQAQQAGASFTPATIADLFKSSVSDTRGTTAAPWADSVNKALGVSPSNVREHKDYPGLVIPYGLTKGDTISLRSNLPSTQRVHGERDYQSIYVHEMGHILNDKGVPTPILTAAKKADLNAEEFSEALRLGWQRWSGRTPDFTTAKGLEGVSTKKLTPELVNLFAEMLGRSYQNRR